MIRLFGRSPQVAKLLPAREFQAAVERERMRVDRNGSSFVLILLDCGKKPCAKRMTKIAQVLDSELRATDQAGVIDRHHLAIMLPDTDHSGAQTLQERLCDVLGRGDSGWECKFFVYPQDSLPALSAEPPAGTEAVDALFERRLPMWKRGLDIVGASLAIILTLPIMLFTAIAIKATSKGPVLFCQKRAGLGGRPFTIYKFRTMLDGAEELKASLRARSEQDGPAFKIKHDPRITTVGKYLRKTCIDEFPQFWNVLCGDMSLVGPRPLPIDEAANCEPWQRRRMSVTPGLTCTWQVSGGMRIPFIEWMRMDIRYANSQRLLGDLALLWKTLWVVVFHRASH